MAIAGVGLGANRGDRLRTLVRAVGLLRRCGTLLALSSVVETEPFGEPDQPRFLNQVLLLETELSPREMLRHLKSLERRLGRTPTYRWGPREIDLDLLFHGSLRLEWPGLSLPHPGLCERGFVLEPLLEIAPEWARFWCPASPYLRPLTSPTEGASPMTQGIDHLAIAARDTQALADWYCRVLGFEVIFTSQKNPPTFLVRRGAHALEIMPSNDSAPVPHAFFDPGIRHIALSVADFDAAYQQLQAEEVAGLESPGEAAGGGRLANFLDPEGNQLQIVWRPSPLANLPAEGMSG
ncbi:MAG TPA: 2-amino-4-hydroxy-6-hydroxymethyldihydropteridine diphosphokinase [Armatimonadota bacterium]|jgi:2-amino-4-hydroxy-6-hydroxymethyldihydropteridine diphosphokinase